MNKKQEYFHRESHAYMQYESDDFSFFVFQMINNLIGQFDSKEVAVEIGAGMGRFSAPVVNNFKQIYLIEPSASFCEALKEKFSDCNHVKICNDTADSLLKANFSCPPKSLIFVFHTLHHMNYEQRQTIFEIIAKKDLVGVFVEPNPYNLLILLQILITPEMSFSEEKEYLKLTRGTIEKEISVHKLKLEKFKRCCNLPPGLIARLLKNKRSIVDAFESIPTNFIPFLSAYHIMICRKE